MGNQYIDISRDIRNMLTLTVCNAIGHEHGDAVKLHTVNSDAACSEIVTVVIQTIDIGIIQAIVVVAGNESLLGLRQVTKPVEKANSLVHFTAEGKVSGMYNHVGSRKVFQPPMLTVSV